MAILFLSNVWDGDEWREALAAHLPDVEFRAWPDAGEPKDVRMAIAWKGEVAALRRFPNLGLIVSLGHGVDHLLAEPGLPADIPVMRMVDESMQRQMPAYVLAAALRHHIGMPEYARAQAEARWASMPPRDPCDTTIGVLGLGALGAVCARHAAAIGFRVLGWSRSPKAIDGVTCLAGDDGRARLLAESDVVVVLVPLTPETEDMLDADAFAAMKDGAYLINAARGRLVVDDDLIAALDSGKLAGATLDVFRTEPLPPDHPYWRHPKVTVTPHTAADTIAASCAPQVAENYRRLIDGRPLINLVDREAGY